MTVRELLRETETALSRRESARFDARQLLLGLAKRDTGWLLSHGEDLADEDLIAAVRDGVGRLAAGEPLQYILGSWDFYGLRFAVGPGVLIPRADTETVVEAALARLSGVERPVIWDLCSGSGAIALALWHSRPDAVVTAVELSEEALPYLRKNAAALSGGVVRVVAADVLAPLPAMRDCDLIVSNPPYITDADMAALPPEVRREPEMALRGGADGLRFYRALTKSAFSALRPGGWLLFEIGYDQGESVPALLTAAGYQEVFLQPDLAGVPRCAGGRRPL